MSVYLNYLVEANLCLLLFYVFFYFFLRKETIQGVKRFFLVGSILFSLFFPLIQFSTQAAIIPSVGEYAPAFFLPELVIGGGGEETAIARASSGVPSYLMVGLYFLGLIVLAIRTIIGIRKITALIYRCPPGYEVGKVVIIESPEKVSSFSIFNLVVLGNVAHLSEAEKEQIKRHEMVHVTRYHTWDVLLIELVCIVFWFNPIVYQIRKALSDVHEYEADELSTRDVDVQQYCSLLARITLESAGFSLANHFNKSRIVKRINMMKTEKRKMSRWKWASIVTAIGVTFFTVSCQDQVLTEINEVAKSSSVALDYPEVVGNRLTALQKLNPEGTYQVIEFTDDKGKAKLSEMKSKYGEQASMEIIETRVPEQDVSRSFAIIRTDGVGMLADATKQDGEVFMIVEESARPSDGMTPFYEFVAANLRVPSAAKEANVNGKVFIEFVVEKDGTLSQFKALKGIGYGCEEEAIRVLSIAPAWKPGKQRGRAVRQKMVLPINFVVGSSVAVVSPAEPSQMKMFIEITGKEESGSKIYVKGLVKDEKGTPLAGANVLVGGTTSGTVSNLDGTFAIGMSSGEELVVSFVGYETRRVLP